jgi:hypothetical protein
MIQFSPSCTESGDCTQMTETSGEELLFSNDNPSVVVFHNNGFRLRFESPQLVQYESNKGCSNYYFKFSNGFVFGVNEIASAMVLGWRIDGTTSGVGIFISEIG